MNTSTSTTAGQVVGTTTPLQLGRPSYWSQRSAFDWVYAALLLAGAGYAWLHYGAAMNGYERGIFVCALPALIWLGWAWAPLRGL
ncbi:MAG TPA: c-type cytochrome biogenesis protein CcsB, partial [Burkholderiaceae bacterium]|nr:c-type cytochrome biogenesis protein CcsB [Burkholderiaceae bacterium]